MEGPSLLLELTSVPIYPFLPTHLASRRTVGHERTGLERTSVTVTGRSDSVDIPNLNRGGYMLDSTVHE